MGKTARYEPIEDIVDFYRRWPDLRSEAEQIMTDAQLDEEQKTLMKWMVFVIDRVGPADLEADNHNKGDL